MLQIHARPLAFFDKDDGAGDNPSSQDEEQPTGGDVKEKKAVAFTQDQLDKMVVDAKKQARQSELNKVLEKTGFKSEAELLEAVAAHKKSEEDKLSAEQKAQKALDDEKSKNFQIAKELNDLRFERNFDKAVNKLALEFKNEKARDTAFKLLDAETAGKGEKEMEEAINALVKEHSYLFNEPEDVEIDATKRGKPNKNSLKKEIVESKRRSGQYSSL